MNRVPVVQVITKLEFGGAQQHALHIAASLDRERFEPVLITGPEGYLMEEARKMGIDLRVAPSMERPVNPLADARAYRELVEHFRPFRNRPAIVHTNSSKAGVLGRWAARRVKIPLILHTIHGFGFTPGQGLVANRLFKTAEKVTSSFTDHFVAVSDKNREDGIALGIFPPEKCTVIRSGIDLDEFLGAEPVETETLLDLGIPAGAPLVLMVACLKPQKAPLDFVEVAALAHREVPQARFLLAGDGELRRTLEKEVARSGLKEVFFPLGWREDVPGLMKSSQVVVLTSRWEGLPRVIPQAKAAGRPVVATAVDGSMEAVREGVDGFLCPAGDVAALADRVIRLLKDPEKARAMGRRGLDMVPEWDQKTMVRDHEELYERLLEEKSLK